MKNWSFKVKVGVYSAMLTMAALLAGAVVMMVSLYFYQINQLDENLGELANELVWDLANFRNAPKDPSEALGLEFIPIPLRNDFVVVEGPKGKVVYHSKNLGGKFLRGEVGNERTEVIAGKRCRVGAWQAGPYLIHIGADINMVDRLLRDLSFGFLTALPAVGLVVFFGGTWLARRTVEPVAQLSAAAERITADNPGERLPMPAAQDEIAKLTVVLNESFDRLQVSYDAAIRFSADASHQLKTPVTVLRAGLDNLARNPELNESVVGEVSVLIQQTRRLTALIEDLLLLAQADAKRMGLERTKFDLVPLIAGYSDDASTQVMSKDVQVQVNLPEALAVEADQRIMKIVFQNLIENAVKYSPSGGKIRIEAGQEKGEIVVRISNTGEQISGDQAEVIFERFRRGENTGEGIRGHGLGLNISRELIRAHGGSLLLIEGEPGWVVFEVRLPS